MKRFYGIGILLVLIFLFFLPAILKPDSMYAPIDIVYMYKPWSEYKSIIPENLLQSDAGFMIETNNRLMRPIIVKIKPIRKLKGL